MADLAIVHRLPASASQVREAWKATCQHCGQCERTRHISEGSEHTNDSARRVYFRAKAADASGIAVKELKKQEVDVLLAKLVASTEGKLKYQRAAANPLNAVAPDRPLPQTEKEAADWLRLRDYRRALAVYDELARTYPELVEAHSRSAWLRATCPDAKYRDGKLAVESARRACELTDWHNPGELEVLAAAFAEAGDFGSAVKWQEKALTLTVEPADIQSCQKRLALYLAGKTFGNSEINFDATGSRLTHLMEAVDRDPDRRRSVARGRAIVGHHRQTEGEIRLRRRQSHGWQFHLCGRKWDSSSFFASSTISRLTGLTDVAHLARKPVIFEGRRNARTRVFDTTSLGQRGLQVSTHRYPTFFP